MKKKFQIITVFSLLGLILITNVLSMRHKTRTVDEERHIAYGLRIVRLISDRFDDSKMPVTSLNVIPCELSARVQPYIHSPQLLDFFCSLNTTRFVTVLFSLLLAIYVFRWASELYGFFPGIFALSLYALSPNIIAHSRLVTTDIYATGIITITLYYFWKFNNKGGWRNTILSALTLGLSQLTKYSCIFLYPIFFIIIVIRFIGNFSKDQSPKRFWKPLGKFLLNISIFVIVSILIINIGFFFNKTGTSLEHYSFKSPLFRSIQSNFELFSKLPIFLPYPYIQGLDMVMFNERTGWTGQGTRGCGNYLFGEVRFPGQDFTGFPWYFIVVLLYKVPIPMQFFCLLALFLYLKNLKTFIFLKNEVFLVVPVLIFVLYFNFFFREQIGVRFYLVIFPLIHVFCGSLVRKWNSMGLKFHVPMILLYFYLIISVFSYFPHYISYFNELLWDRKEAYKILADSNIDWGQNKWYLQQYTKCNPDISVNPEFPVHGRIVVEVNRLVGICNFEQFRWLRENFEPVDHIAYSYLIYDVSEDDLMMILGPQALQP